MDQKYQQQRKKFFLSTEAIWKWNEVMANYDREWAEVRQAINEGNEEKPDAELNDEYLRIKREKYGIS